MQVNVVLQITGDPDKFDVDSFKEAVAAQFDVDPSQVTITIERIGKKRAPEFRVVIVFKVPPTNELATNGSAVNQTLTQAFTDESSPLSVQLAKSNSTAVVSSTSTTEVIQPPASTSTTASATQDNLNTNDSDNKSNTNTIIIAAVVAGVGGLALIAGVVFVLHRKRQNRSLNKDFF